MIDKTIKVQNLKCGGCAKTIETRLSNIEGLYNLSIDITSSSIHFTLVEESLKKEVSSTLKSLGYPEIGSSNTLINKATSYVSCAIGKIP